MSYVDKLNIPDAERILLFENKTDTNYCELITINFKLNEFEKCEVL